MQRQKNKKIGITSVILLSVSLIFLSGRGLYPASTLKWYDFNSGSKEAKRLKRPMMIDMYASWCGWCKVMEKETFRNEKVAAALNNGFIAVRVDMESGEKIKYKSYSLRPGEFSSIFGVQGLPTVVFLDADGEYIDKIPGFVKADLFLKILEYIRDGCHKKKVSFQDYAEGRAKCK